MQVMPDITHLCHEYRRIALIIMCLLGSALLLLRLLPGMELLLRMSETFDIRFFPSFIVSCDLHLSIPWLRMRHLRIASSSTTGDLRRLPSRLLRLKALKDNKDMYYHCSTHCVLCEVRIEKCGSASKLAERAALDLKAQLCLAQPREDLEPYRYFGISLSRLKLIAQVR